jgi:DNA-3-methyladenine glycosylase II
MTFFIHTEADLDKGIHELVDADPRFVPVLAVAGRPPLRRREGSFAGLASIVISQQLSTASAGAIRSSRRPCCARERNGSSESACRQPRSAP